MRPPSPLQHAYPKLERTTSQLPFMQIIMLALGLLVRKSQLIFVAANVLVVVVIVVVGLVDVGAVTLVKVVVVVELLELVVVVVEEE